MSKRCPTCKRPPNDITLTPGHVACEYPKPSETCQKCGKEPPAYDVKDYCRCTLSETEEVREWTLDKVDGPNLVDKYILKNGPALFSGEEVHVIEKSTYDKLQAEHRADLKTAIEREYKLQQELSEAKELNRMDHKRLLNNRDEINKLRSDLSSARREVEAFAEQNAELLELVKGNDFEREQQNETNQILVKALSQERARSAELLSALEFYASGQHALSEFNDGGKAREAIKKHNSGKGG